ncbi:MAG: nuclease [Desulfobulbus propionicus]|nr:MAG: nuclease [Desulfobulbus propionicus]
MNNIILRNFLVLSTATLFICINAAWGGQAYVLKVLDGDSIQVKEGARIYDIRLYGVDAPEYDQHYGNRARRFTSELIRRKNITVQAKYKDRYGRVVAVVMSQGKNVSKELVRNGLAWVHPYFCKDKRQCSMMTQDQLAAKKAKLGLWKDAKPIPPWKWKKSRRR